MTYLTRLPALLKLALLIGLLSPIVALAILVLRLMNSEVLTQLLPGPLEPLGVSRASAAVAGLVLVGVGCALAVASYTSRFRGASTRRTQLDTMRSQAGVLVLLTALPAAQLALGLVAQPDFPLMSVGLGLDAVELVLIVGAVISLGSQPRRATAAGETRGNTSEQKRTPGDQGAGGIGMDKATDDQLPFHEAWWSFDLGKYRPCNGTYCYYPVDSLPPLQPPAGALDWLGPLDEPTDRQMEVHRNAPEERGALQSIQAEAARLQLTLPEIFVRLMGSAVLQDRIPSCTACFFKLSEHITPCVGAENGYVVRFLNDQQDVFMWFLYLAPDGDQRVLVSSAPLDELASEYPQGPTDDQRKAIIAHTFVCAPTFDAFIYRWWLENTIWFNLDSNDAGKRTDEERRYLAYYEQQQGTHSAE